MSVFTPLQRAELETFLEPYRLGRLHAFEGVAGGSENSNFFVSLDAGEYVLTLVERGSRERMEFVVDLLERLRHAGLPVPYAIAEEDGIRLRQLAEKPALLQPRLPGSHVAQPNAHHCEEVGRLLAGLHLATRDDPLVHASDRGLPWMIDEGSLLALEFEGADLELLRAAITEAAMLQDAFDELPAANLHADLFRDNVLFDGSHLSGVIDFHNACSGPMLYDLAIAANDWCSNQDGSLDLPRLRALLGGYAALRAFSRAEGEHWPSLLRIACLRFWLSRLLAAKAAPLAAEDGHQVLLKDPQEFRRRLAARQRLDTTLPFAF